MNELGKYTLRCLRHAYQGIFGSPTYTPIPLCSINEGSEQIYKILLKKEPCMIARYGANELNCVLNYIEIKYGEHKIWKNIKGEGHDWWWNKGMSKNMLDVAGFYPITSENLSRFAELMLEDTKLLDALAVFPPIKKTLPRLKMYIPEKVTYFPMTSYDFFLFDKSWVRFLEGKKVLVIHPFKELIEQQYKKKEILFNNPETLPDFELITLKAVQSIGGINEQGFGNWFEGLEWMKSEIDKIDYDVALIGCGAYGFPLAAHVKRKGKMAVHIGGKLQLFFGIRGKRWENPLYGTKEGFPIGTYSEMLNNPAWVRPTEYKTKESENAENACYW